MSIRALFTTLLALASYAGGSIAQADTEIQLYRVKARPAAELAGIVAPLLAPDGTAVADDSGGFVLVRGSAEAVLQALETLTRLDVAPRQYRVETELTSQAALQARGVEVAGWIQVGDLRVGRAGRPAAGMEVRAQQLRADSTRQLQASVVALEGTPAEIWTGNVFPVGVRSFRGGRGHREVEVHETTWVPVRQGLRVVARSAGDQVELELVPVVEDGHPETGIREVGAATRVRVRPGEELVIGSLERTAASGWSDPLAERDAAHRSEELMLLRVSEID